MPIFCRPRFVSKIHFLDCNCACDQRRLELQRVLEITHAPGLVYESRSFTGTIDKATVTFEYSEYHAIGHPKSIRNGKFGRLGDIFIDLTPLNHKLYAKLSLDQWTLWPGPWIVSSALRHPLFPRQMLSCWFNGETRTLGWSVKHSRVDNYSTSGHEIIATFLASRETRSPSPLKKKRKSLSQSDFDKEPPAKKSRKQCDIVNGNDNSIPVWRGLPNTVLFESLLKPTNSKTGEITASCAIQQSIRQDPSLDDAPSRDGLNPLSATAMYNPKTPVSTTPTITSRLPLGLHDTVSVQPSQVPFSLVRKEGANVDLLVRAADTDLASFTGVGSSNNSSENLSIDALLPTLNKVKMCTPPPGAPVIDSEPCSTTPDLPTTPRQLIPSFDQPHTADSAPITDPMLPVADDSIAPNNSDDLVLTIPNFSEEITTHELPDEFIASGELSFAASQPNDSSRQFAISSHSRRSPELGLALGASTISVDETSPAHQTIRLRTASPLPSPRDNLDQASNTSITRPIDLVSSEGTAKIECKEAEEGTQQPEFAPNRNNISCAGQDEEHKDEPVKEPQVLMSTVSDLFEESTAGDTSLSALLGDSSTSPPGQKVKEPELMLKEEPPTRGSFADEECEPPRNDSPSVASIPPFTVNANSDTKVKEVPRLEADLIKDDSSPDICILTTELDRWRMEVIYHRLENQTELMCRLCLAASPEQIPILPADTPFHVLAGHCQEEHMEYYDLLMGLEVDQLQVIKSRLVGLMS